MTLQLNNSKQQISDNTFVCFNKFLLYLFKTKLYLPLRVNQEMNKSLITIITISLFLGITTTSIICENAYANPGEIDVYSPSSGSTYYEGFMISIAWTYSFGSGDWVSIELHRGGSFLETISSNTSNDGQYSWTIPSGYSSASNFQIKVENLTDPYDSGISDSFYIRSRYIKITSPTSGDTWFGGDTYEITWESDNAGNYVQIEYKNEGNYYTLTPSTFNSGSYYWFIPSSIASSSPYEIKITSLSDSSVYSYSGYFTIGKRSLTINSPTGGEVLYTGETYTITWSSENVGNFVSIQYKKYQSTFFYVMESKTDNDGSYDWMIPTSLSIGSQYQIKVQSYSMSDIYDVSGYFSIGQRYIDIHSPRWDDRWHPNETYSIFWSWENAGSSVDMRLFKNDVYCATIASNINISDTYYWTIPDIFASDSNYKIEVRSRDYSVVYDYSDEFSIKGRSIDIFSPGEKAIWYTDETLEIEWDSENAGYYVYIELFKDGERYKTIDSNAENTGNYHWHIPSDLPSSESYQIKITSLQYRDVYGFSEGNLTVDVSFGQLVFPPFIVTIIVIIFILAVYKTIQKIRKRKKKKSEKNGAGPQKIMQPSSQASQTRVTSEEYDQIWEENKP